MNKPNQSPPFCGNFRRIVANTLWGGAIASTAISISATGFWMISLPFVSDCISGSIQAFAGKAGLVAVLFLGSSFAMSCITIYQLRCELERLQRECDLIRSCNCSNSLNQ